LGVENEYSKSLFESSIGPGDREHADADIMLNSDGERSVSVISASRIWKAVYINPRCLHLALNLLENAIAVYYSVNEGG
jgi:hypothetical protein